jgi:probable F420-dependent oxidoreductase
VPLALDVRLDGGLVEVPEAVRQLEEAGIAGVFTYEGPRDVFLPLAVAAPISRSLALYTNLAIALPRSPMHLAHLGHDLQHASGGRFSLGLGTQVKAHVTRRYGTVWESPVEQLREWVLAVRAIHASWQTGEPLDFEGRWTRHTYCPPLFDPGPLEAGPPPLLVGALGPRMTTMATQVADGLLVHPFCTDRSLAEHTFPLVDAGLNGRRDFTLVGQGILAVGRDERELATALAAVRSLIAFYASTPAYRVVLDVHGWGDLQGELRELTRAGRWDELAAAVPQEVVDAVAVVGTPEQVAERLGERYARCDRVALSIPYAVPLPTLAALADAARSLRTDKNTF